MTSGLPIFFIEDRVGLNGKNFRLFKFRTMVKNAPRLKSKVKYLNEADGPVFKIHHDPRFTKIGRYLSHTGLDELPQLFNVLKGEMALIGPRPLPIAESSKLKSWQLKRLQIKPGIISPWIVSGYHNQSFSKWMKSDIKYVQNKNFFIDVVVLIQSIVFVIKQLIHETKISI